MMRYLTILAILLCVIETTAQSVVEHKTRILFLLDASYSMGEAWGGETKWSTATRTLLEMADSSLHADNIEFGLRVFGHNYGLVDKNCKDSRLEIPIGPSNTKLLKRKVHEIKPNGITPLVYSIEKSEVDFGIYEEGTKNILILITDGAESCGGDPCSLSQLLQQKNIILKPYVIGLKLDKSVLAQYECIGKFINTNSPEELNTVLKKIADDMRHKTTVQVNLLDHNNKPTETGLAMSLYDQETGVLKYNFQHTLNGFGLPDTFEIVPSIPYRLVIHSLPPIVKENITLTKNMHNTISVHAAQGTLQVEMQGIAGTRVNDRIKTLIRHHGSTHTLHVQRVNTKQKYLEGEYEADILTLPRIHLDHLAVDQNKTTTIRIPLPGTVSISKTFDAYGAVFTTDGTHLQKIYDLRPSIHLETISLQPGKYRIVYRSKFAKSIHTTIDKEFTIQSGGAMTIKL
jgi:Ca-activated chloride channel homolog